MSKMLFNRHGGKCLYLAIGRLQFKVNLGYTARPSLKKRKKKKHAIQNKYPSCKTIHYKYYKEILMSAARVEKAGRCCI